MIQQIHQSIFVSALKSERTADEQGKSDDFLAMVDDDTDSSGPKSGDAESPSAESSLPMLPLNANLTNALADAETDFLPEHVAMAGQGISPSLGLESDDSDAQAPEQPAEKSASENPRVTFVDKVEDNSSADVSQGQFFGLPAENSATGDQISDGTSPEKGGRLNDNEDVNASDMIDSPAEVSAAAKSMAPQADDTLAVLPAIKSNTAIPAATVPLIKSSATVLPEDGQKEAAVVLATPAAPTWKSTRAESIWQTRPKAQSDDAMIPLPLLVSAGEIPDSRSIDSQVAAFDLPDASVDTKDLFPVMENTVLKVEQGTKETDRMTALWGGAIAMRQNDLLFNQQLNAPIPAVPKPPPDLAAQITHHMAAAKAGGVELVLSPQELGKIRFEIQQVGDGVRVVLTAERPETIEMLRRHSDQLLQEFRQSGFTGSSLSFGNWNQRGQSETPSQQQSDIDDLQNETASYAAMPPVAIPIYVEGQGLNLRL